VVVERTSPTGSQVRFLIEFSNKGIVIDAWFRIAVMGIDVITVQARVVVACIRTYLDSSQALALAGSASPIAAWTKAVTSTNGRVSRRIDFDSSHAGRLSLRRARFPDRRALCYCLRVRCTRPVRRKWVRGSWTDLSFFMGCHRAAAPRRANTGLWINSQPSAGRSVGLTSWRQRDTYDRPTV